MLILARHGQSEANAAELLNGRHDVPLTEVGRAQAQALAAALPVDIDLVVASPLLRARETAAAVGRSVEIDERWVEMDFGTWEGRPLAEMRQDLTLRRLADPDFAPPGGESLTAVGERVRSACEALAARARDAHVLVVTHVSPIKATVAWALGADDRVAWRMFVDLASVTTVAVADHGPVLLRFNHTAHLDGVDRGASKEP